MTWNPPVASQRMQSNSRSLAGAQPQSLGPHTAHPPPSSLASPLSPPSSSSTRPLPIPRPGRVATRRYSISIPPAAQTTSSTSFGSPLMRLNRHHSRSPVADGHRSTCSASDESSRRSSGSDRSDHSYRSQSTVPTEHDSTDYLAFDDHGECTPKASDDHASEANPRASVETYASSAASIQECRDGEPDYELPEFRPDDCYDDTIPTTPADFSRLFPSARKLTISHDESSPDGNMNLKVNTEVRTPRGRLQNMTLFYLRLYDLRTREFSLRRYDRNSGREVCHSVRQYAKPSEQVRPGLQKTLSNAFAMIRAKSDTRMNTRSSFGQHADGGGSTGSFDSDDSGRRPGSACHDSRVYAQVPMDTDRLEFSNYAKVQIKQRGSKSGKRYEFEYWGTTYQWKQTSPQGEDQQTCYVLSRAGDGVPLARIVPEPLSPPEQRHELEKGGWVPPCAMWIIDERFVRAQKDIADVLVASGLAALVDDCIRRRFCDTGAKNAMSRLRWHSGRPNSSQSSEDATSDGFRPSGHGTAPMRGPTRLRSATHH